MYWNYLEFFFSAWGTEKIARLWFDRGISTQADTMDTNMLLWLILSVFDTK